MATLPAVVTIQDLPTGTTLSGTELLEAVQTVGGVAISIQVPISQIATTSLGGLPTGGATGQLLDKASGTSFATQWVNLSSLLTAGSGLTTSGSTAVMVSLGSAAGLSVLGVTGAATAVPAAIVGTADQVMVINHAGSSAVFGQVNLATSAAVTGVLPAAYMTAVNLAAAGPGGVQGILPVPNGGIGTSTLTSFGLLYGRGTSTVGIAAPATSGLPLIANGTAVAPSYQPLTVANISAIPATTLLANTSNTTAAPSAVIYGSVIGNTLLNVMTASAATFILDTTSFTSTYNNYVIYVDNVMPTNSTTQFQLLVRSGGVLQTASYINLTGGATTYLDFTQAVLVATTAGLGFSGISWLSNINSTSTVKFLRAQMVGVNNLGAISAITPTGYWNSTGALTGFQLQVNTGTFSGTVTVYGLRAA